MMMMMMMMMMMLMMMININFKCRPAFPLVLVLFSHALSFPLLAMH